MLNLGKATPALVAVTVLLLGAGSIVMADQPVTSPTAPAEGSVAADKTLQSYDLSWWSVDGGGGSSSGGSFALVAAVGQPDVAASTSGGAALAGGVWAVPEAVEALIFNDDFEGGDTSAWTGVSPGGGGS